MKIRSAVPENGCLIVLLDGKKTKKNKKNNCKTYTHPPPTGRRLRKLKVELSTIAAEQWTAQSRYEWPQYCTVGDRSVHVNYSSSNSTVLHQTNERRLLRWRKPYGTPRRTACARCLPDKTTQQTWASTAAAITGPTCSCVRTTNDFTHTTAHSTYNPELKHATDSRTDKTQLKARHRNCLLYTRQSTAAD